MAKSEKGKRTKAAAKGKQAATVDLAAAEAELIKKYPKQKIVKGSIRAAGTVDGFGNKRTVEIHCHYSNKPFRLATSDLHQTIYSKESKEAMKADKKAAKKPKATKKTTAKAEKKATPKKEKAEKKPTEKKPGGNRRKKSDEGKEQAAAPAASEAATQSEAATTAPADTAPTAVGLEELLAASN